MSTQPLQMAADVSRQVMANVSAEQMQNATPCKSWDVTALINHMVGAQHFFRSGVEGVAPEGAEADFAAGDYIAAFDDASSALIASFGKEGMLEATVKMPFGEMPGRAVMGLAINDTFTHAWDLAKATGQNTDLAPELAQMVLAQARENIQEGFRGDEPMPFGVEQQCADDACAADQLAAFLGREV